MESSDQKAFLIEMQAIGALHKQAMSEFLVEIYWAALLPFEFSAVKKALQAHNCHPDTGQYMPKPADVVRHLQGSSKTQALQAWSLVRRAIREVGSYSSVVFDDAAIHAVITDMGGWTTLCSVTVDELPFRGHDFQARYAGYVGHPPGAYPAALTGRLACQNGHTTHAESPVFLGNFEKAQQVYAQGTGGLPPSKSASNDTPLALISNFPEEDEHDK